MTIEGLGESTVGANCSGQNVPTRGVWDGYKNVQHGAVGLFPRARRLNSGLSSRSTEAKKLPNPLVPRENLVILPSALAANVSSHQ